MYGSFVQKFAILLCLLLFIHEVHPLALKKNVKEESLPNQDENLRGEQLGERSKRSVEKEKRESIETGVANYEPHNREKRWVNYVLLGLTLLTMTGSLAWDIYLDQKGCCGITDACDDREVYEQLSETLETKSKQIDAIYTNAINMDQYASTLNTYAQVLWLKMEYFNDTATQLVEFLDDQVFTKFNNESLVIQQELEDLNAELDDWDGTVARYQSVFSSVESTLLRISGFLVLGGTYLYSKISSYIATKTAATVYSGGSVSPSYAVKARMFSAVSNYAKNTVVAQKLRARFDTADDMKVALKTGANAALTIITIVVEAWRIAETFEYCNEIAETAAYARSQLEEQDVVADELIVNATWLYDNSTDSYNTLREQIADESMIVWAGQIRDLAAGADIQNESLIQAQEDIQAFIDGIETADYDGTVALTEQLIDGVNNVTFKLYCLTAKFAALKYAVSECAEGSGNISTLFEETQSLAVANSGGCVDSGYIQYENFTTYVDLEMLEQGKQTDCILNNKDKFNTVCEKYYLASNETEDDIASDVGLTDAQVEYFIGICPPASVHGKTLIESSICNSKYSNSTVDEVIAELYKYNSAEITEVYDDCPLRDVEDVTGLATLICDLKTVGYSVDTIIADYPLVNSTQINSTYQGCVIEWLCADENQVCNFAGFGFTIDGQFGSVYDQYEETYGTDEVQAKIDECLDNPGVDHCASGDEISLQQFLRDPAARRRMADHHLKHLLDTHFRKALPSYHKKREYF